MVVGGVLVSLVAALLAVTGKGKGRFVTTFASAVLALSWAMFP